MKRFTAKKERCEYAEKGSPGYGVEKRDLVPVALVMVCSVRKGRWVQRKPWKMIGSYWRHR